jgi:hypothetical protein
MDRLTGFGLFAVSAMLVCYALEERSAWFILAFAGSGGLGSAYDFPRGAWPFGYSAWLKPYGRWSPYVDGITPEGREASGSANFIRFAIKRLWPFSAIATPLMTLTTRLPGRGPGHLTLIVERHSGGQCG